MTRKGPKSAYLEGASGPGRDERDLERALRVRRLARVEHPDAVAERALEREQVVQREIGVRAREHDEREVAVLLPGLQEERVVAEQDVVGAGRGGEVGGRLGARLLP